MAYHRSTSLKQLRQSSILFSRKILLLLMWEMLFKLSWCLLIEGTSKTGNLEIISISITESISLLLAPLAGLLADVKLGRYEIIKIGTIISLLASLLYYCGLLLGGTIKTLLFCTTIILFCFSDTCYSAAMLPFLTDQIIGATSDKLSAVVRWYYWAKHIGFLLCSIILNLIINKLSIRFGAVLFIAVPLAVVIVSDCLCQQWLDRTHKVTNPIKLIIQVLNYTRKHRYPERRSVFTYIDEEQPTRMDFGKAKFGGPFTEEEVENVKTVLRLIPMIICFSLFVMTLTYTPVVIMNSKESIDTFVNQGLKNWLIPVLLIPFHQFLVRPCVRYSWSMLRCIGAAMLMCAVCYMLLTASAVLDVVLSNDMHSYLSCAPHNTTEHVDIWYLKICSLILYSFSKTLVCVLVLEFLFAQSPDNMKGFVLGLSLGSSGIVYLIIMEAEKLQITLCYDLQAMVVLVVLFVVFLVLAKCYILRERSREINIQAIVEEHYERYINQEENYRKASNLLTHDQSE